MAESRRNLRPDTSLGAPKKFVSFYFILPLLLKLCVVNREEKIYSFSSNPSLTLHRKGAVKGISEGSKLTFTCLKSTMKTLDKGVKYVQS